MRERRPATRLNGSIAKHEALESARAHARAVWNDPVFRTAVLNNELSVHDAADMFRAELVRLLETKRILQAAGPCSVCGERPEHPNHFDEEVEGAGHALLKGHDYKS